MKKLLIGAVALMAVACSQGGETAAPSLAGDWKVSPEQSRVSFVTIKAGTVVEPHFFKGVSGDVKGDGTATVKLDLKSLVTQPDTRFTRMQEKLFEVTTYPEATITAKLDPAKFEGMAIGERKIETVPINVDLHGAKVDYDAEVYVTRTGPNSVVVDTTNPIIVEAGDFNLKPGLDELQKLANLNAITPATPVTFSLTLTK